MGNIFEKVKKAFIRNERGQSLVEFALVFPVLIIFLSGVADTGWMIYNYSSLSDITDTAVHANIKSDRDEAAEFVKLYIRNSFPDFDESSMVITADTRVKRYDYYEYFWKPNQGKHWKVPMYYKTLKTSLTVSYRVDYLTPMGKLLFGDTDNSMDLTCSAVSAKVLENDSYKNDEGDDADG